MRVAVLKETAPGERRVALVPDAVKRLNGTGFDIAVERGAGEGASFRDGDYEAAGAVVGSRDETLRGADAVVKVQRPSAEEVDALPEGAVLVAFLAAWAAGDFEIRAA